MNNKPYPGVLKNNTIKEPKLLFVRPELLLHPTLPEPLHGLNPRTIMGKKEWDKIRRKAYSTNNYHCFACGKYAPYDIDKNRFSSEVKLHAHECYDFDYNAYSTELVEVVALCPICHDAIHMNRLQSLYNREVVDEEYMWIVNTNKDNVLGFNDENWSKWKLIYGWESHYSKFKNREEWEEHYNKQADK